MNISIARPLLVSGGVAVIAAAVTLTLVFVVFQPSSARASTTFLTILSGTDITVRIANEDSFRSAIDGESLGNGDTVQTGIDSRAVITSLDGSTIELEPETQITLTRIEVTSDNRSISLSQAFGTTWHNVLSVLSGTTEYEVETPAAVAAVRDTLFKVSVEPDGTTTLTVAEGSVSVQAAGQEVVVSAGQQSQVTPGETPGDPVDAPPPTSELRIRLGSPAFALVTDPATRSIGAVPPGIGVNQVPDAITSSPEAEPFDVIIPEPITGRYRISIEAKGDGGAYTLAAQVANEGVILLNALVDDTVLPGERWVIFLDLTIVNGRVIAAEIFEPTRTTGEPAGKVVITDLQRERVAQVVGLEATPASTDTDPPVIATRTPEQASLTSTPRPSVTPQATATLLPGQPPATDTPTFTPPPPPTQPPPPPPPPLTLRIGIVGGTAPPGATLTAVLTGSFPDPGVLAYDVKVTWDADVFVYQSCTGLCNGSGGFAQAVGAFATGQTGVLVMSNVTLRAVGAPGQCTDLFVQVNEVVLGGNVPIAPPVYNGRVCVS